ncbi:MAG: NADH-quinone oxidoreductase subunit NuoG [Deinococcaceae bacterium]
MNITVDGRSLEVPPGTSAIDAVFAAGLDVPYFCSQPYLSPIGACRMCLVEAGSPRKNPDGSWILDESGQPKIFWFPKPQASCTLMATEGMVIISQSEKVKKAQAGMMEFTLINHPLDCPTCDKGGACELQDRAYEYGYGTSRFEFDRRHADKHHLLSDFVVLDQERCIHCKRCVRYFEEVPGEEILDFIERGGHTFIDSMEDGLPSHFSGNITDICPVGALLDNVSRFRGRNWEFDHTPSTCTACSVGCSITVDARNGQLERIQGRENYSVNETWLCDAGRFGHEWLREERLHMPLVRKDGQLVPTTWEEAVSAIKEGLSGIQTHKMGLYTKSDITLEEAIGLERFAQQLGTTSVDHAPRSAVASDMASPTLVEVAQADFVCVLGADLHEEAPVVALRIEEMLKGGLLPPVYDHGTAIADLRMPERAVRLRNRLAVFSATKTRLHTKAGFSGTVSIRTLLGQLETATHAAWLEALQKAERPVIMVGHEALSSNCLPEIEALCKRVSAKLLVVSAASNAGLKAMTLVPQLGGSGLDTLAVPAALVSRISKMDVSFDGFLIVHDTHLTPLAQKADVVLPARSNYEKRGTTLNLEHRLLALQAAPINAGESVDLIGCLGILGEALSITPEIRGTRSAQRAIRAHLGWDVSEIPQQGQLVSIGHTMLKPVSGIHDPEVSMWKSEMCRVDRIQKAKNMSLVSHGGD